MNEMRLAHAQGLADQGMSEEEYRFLVEQIYKTAWASEVAKANDGKGSKVTGKIINPTSVTHETAQISVRIGAESATFTLPRVPPGVAQPFELTMPNVPPADARKAFFALDGSTISFASSTTRKRNGGEPVDTDKLLK